MSKILFISEGIKQGNFGVYCKEIKQKKYSEFENI